MESTPRYNHGVSRVVTLCTDSTVTEAWATVLGAPGPVVEDETGALVHMARKRLPPLKSVPAVVLAQFGSEAVPPYWREQFTWDNNQFLARVGHRYLSVHFLKKADRYDTYATSIEPAIRAWLRAAQDVFGDGPETYPVNRIGFGYVNTFEFPAKDFDLSAFFRVNLGIEVPSAGNGLSGLALRFAFVDAEVPSTQVSTQLTVQPVEQGQDLIVAMKVRAETHLDPEYGLGSYDRVSSMIYGAKEAAKRVFFEIATEKTHHLMGAQYAES